MIKQFILGDVVQLDVAFSENHREQKSRWGIVLQQDGALIQVVWASTQKVDAANPLPGEFCVTREEEMRAMGHTKPCRYSFPRGGVVVVRADAVKRLVGKTPASVMDRLVRAARAY